MRSVLLVAAMFLSACGDLVKTDNRSEPSSVPVQEDVLNLTGITLANVCSSPLNGDPGCAEYCGQCGGAAMANYQKTVNEIGMGFSALNSGIGALNSLVGLSTKQRVKALDAITCVHGAIDAATQVGAACLNASCMNWNNINQMAKVQGFLAQGATCFSGFDAVLTKVPYIGQIAMAYKVTAAAQAYLSCNAPNTSGMPILGSFPAVEGAASSCRNAIAAAQPLAPGFSCPLNSASFPSACTTYSATSQNSFKYARFAKIYDVKEYCTKYVSKLNLPGTGGCIPACSQAKLAEIWNECPFMNSFGTPDY